MHRTDSSHGGTLPIFAQIQLTAEQVDEVRPCKICSGPSMKYDMLDFEKFVSVRPYTRPMSAVPVVYRKCATCGFVFTSFFDSFTPEQWSEHVYNDGYKDVDPEFAELRPARNVGAVTSYFRDLRKTSIGLDFGGGSGRTAKCLRALGWRYDCFDPFGLNEMTPDHQGKYNLCTAFEVMEHVPDPVATMKAIVERLATGPLLFLINTTVTDRQVSEANRLNWIYAGPRNGHISLYSHESLRLLAKQHGLDYLSIGSGTHLMSRGHDLRSLRRRLFVGRLRIAIRTRLNRV